MTDVEKKSEKQEGFSKEAWTAISAIAVALIGGMVTIFTTIWKDLPSQRSSPFDSPSEAPTLPSRPPSTSPSSVPSSVPTVVPTASPVAQKLAQDLATVNIDFSDAKERDYLSNRFSKYPQFAVGCLNLLSNQRLKHKAYFDVVFWNYTEELGGKVNSDSPDGDIDTNILKAAMVSAYNTRNGTNALSFGDIIEPRQ